MFELLSVLVLAAALFAGSTVKYPVRMLLGLAVSFLLYGLACYSWQYVHGMPGATDPDFLREAGLLFALSLFIFLLFVYEQRVLGRQRGT